MTKRQKRGWHGLLVVLSMILLLTACTSKAQKAMEKVELGQKYLTEQNYTEAVASFTEAIGLDPENIPAYMGRAQAYTGLKQYDDAKADYTTAIEKTEDQPYTQAEAYIGRAEVNELTTDNEDALSDYESASTALDKVDVEKITDVTEQMLEALKIKVYNACARLSAFFGQNEAAAASYTKALDSLEKLPDDTDVLDVKAAKVESYTGRAKANNALEKYEEVLPDYDALIALGEDKSAERDTILAAMSLAKSKAGSLNSSDSWLDEVNHADYAEEIQLSAAEEVLKQAAEQAKADGTKAYDKVKKTLETEDAKAAMQNLLARGYQLRYYDADGKMLAVYVNDTAWADVNEEENGIVTADALEAVADPTAEDVSAVSLKSLYVYYGSYEGRSREGEGVWFILNPGKTDLTAETYTWKNDKPEGGFQKKEEPKPAAAPAQSTQQSATPQATGQSYTWTRTEDGATFKATCKQGGTTLHTTVTQNGTPILAIMGMSLTGSADDWADHDWTKLVITGELSKPITSVQMTTDQMNVYVPEGTVSKGGSAVFTASDGTTRSVPLPSNGTTPVYQISNSMNDAIGILMRKAG